MLEATGGASLEKLVGQTVILDDGFSASMVKITRFNVWKLKKMISWYSSGQHDHFETEKLQNPSKIGMASHKVGVAEAKVGGAVAPPTE